MPSPHETQYPHITRSDHDVYEVLETIQDFMTTGESEAEANAGIEQLVIGAIPIIRKVADRFSTVHRLTEGDCISSGVEGMFDALSRQTEAVPAPVFFGYAKYRIYDAMFKQSANIGGAVSLNEGALKSVIKVMRIERGLEAGEMLEDLLEKEGMNEAKYSRYSDVRWLFYPLSFEADVHEDEGLHISDNPETDRETMDPLDLICNDEVKEVLADVIDRLPTEKARVTIIRYYGLDGEKPAKLWQIGELLGVTESRICQIHTKALQDLRPLLENKGYL